MKIESRRFDKAAASAKQSDKLRLESLDAKRLGVTIVKRRIVDLTRNSRSSMIANLSLRSDRPQSGTQVDRQVLFENVLKLTLKWIATQKQADRDVFIALIAPDIDEPSSAKDRVRLSRARSRLRDNLENGIGMSLDELFDRS